jgi:hypothetical protein
MEIDIKFYPTGVKEDVRYSITVKEDSLFVKNHSPRTENELSNYKGKLTELDKDSISYLTSKIVEVVRNEQPSILDTWGVTLYVNSKIVYEDDDFSIQGNPKEIKDLIRYLIKISPLKIDLYGFS